MLEHFPNIFLFIIIYIKFIQFNFCSFWENSISLFVHLHLFSPTHTFPFSFSFRSVTCLCFLFRFVLSIASRSLILSCLVQFNFINFFYFILYFKFIIYALINFFYMRYSLNANGTIHFPSLSLFCLARCFWVRIFVLQLKTLTFVFAIMKSFRFCSFAIFTSHNLINDTFTRDFVHFLVLNRKYVKQKG